MDNKELLEKIQTIRELETELVRLHHVRSEQQPNQIIFKIDALNGEILQDLIEDNFLRFVTVDLDSLEEWIKKTNA